MSPKKAGRLQRGDIVLVPFPFTDLSSKKVRPAVVLSPEPTASDILVAFISSVIPEAPGSACDYVIRGDHQDFPATGLKRASVFKMNKLLTIERSLVVRRLGRVGPSLLNELEKRLRIATGIQ